MPAGEKKGKSKGTRLLNILLYVSCQKGYFVTSHIHMIFCSVVDQANVWIRGRKRKESMRGREGALQPLPLNANLLVLPKIESVKPPNVDEYCHAARVARKRARGQNESLYEGGRGGQPLPLNVNLLVAPQIEPQCSTL